MASSCAASPDAAPALTADACSTFSPARRDRPRARPARRLAAPPVFQRPDDNEATVAERLKVYDEKTKPLIEFYREQGILRAIDAEGELDEVTERLEKALGGGGSAGAEGEGCAPG